MKIIKSANIKKQSYTSYDDQPNYIKRDVRDQSCIFDQSTPDNKEDIKKRWKKKNKRERNKRTESFPKSSL